MINRILEVLGLRHYDSTKYPFLKYMDRPPALHKTESSVIVKAVLSDRLMNSIHHLFLLVSVLISLYGNVAYADMTESLLMQREMHRRFQQRHSVSESHSDSSALKRRDGSTITFANPAADKFFVDGTAIPDGEYVLSF